MSVTCARTCLLGSISCCYQLILLQRATIMRQYLNLCGNCFWPVCARARPFGQLGGSTSAALNSSPRRIVNEPAILPILAKFGFEIVRLERFSFADQVRMLAETEFLVSNHGAGLTNMLFMATGQSILELRNDRDAHNNCYFALASAAGLRYFYQLCRPSDPVAPTHSADLVVDVFALERTLEDMCKCR